MSTLREKRNIKKFWKNPLVILCYTLAILAFTAGIFGLAALLGKADTLVFTIISFAVGIASVVLAKVFNSRKKNKDNN